MAAHRKRTRQVRLQEAHPEHALSLCLPSLASCLQVHVKQREGGEVECQVIARGQDADSQQDAAVLTDYFNLETVLSEVGRTWSADARFGSIHPYFNGD